MESINRRKNLQLGLPERTDIEEERIASSEKSDSKSFGKEDTGSESLRSSGSRFIDTKNSNPSSSKLVQVKIENPDTDLEQYVDMPKAS